MLIRISKQLKRKAQSTVEYGILIGVIVAAAIAMQTYIKRSLQAKQKDAADMLTSVTGTVDVAAGGSGSDVSAALGSTNTQYEPYYLARHSETTVTQEDINKNLTAGGAYTGTKTTVQNTKSAVIYRNATGAD